MSEPKKIPVNKAPAAPGRDVIYIDVEDEITSIIDKLENAKSADVSLVLPKRAATLQSIVNMRLLKRAADTAKKEVVLVTAETALLPLAGAAKLAVAKSLQATPAIPSPPQMPTEAASAASKNPDGTGPVNLKDDDASEVNEEDLPKKINYDKSIGALADAHEIDHPEAIEIGDDEEAAVEQTAKKTEKLPKAPKGSTSKVPNFDRFRKKLALGIAGLVALIIFLILAIFILPKATITIDTSTTPVSANLTLNTSATAKALDETNKIIPAILKSSNQTSSTSVNATGQQNNGNKATGTMVLYNCNQSDTLSGTTHTVPAGTGVSNGGLTYVTQAAAVVPPSHFVGSTCKNDAPSNSVNVVAQAGGTKYNQAASSGYSVYGFPSMSGTGSQMSNGTDNITTIVSQSDVDNAKNSITSAQTSAYSKTMEDQLASQGYYVLTSTLKVTDPTATASPDVGQPASTSTVNLQINYSVLAVKKSDLTKAIQDAVASQIDKSKQKVEDTDILAGAQVNVASQSSPTVAVLSITENTSAVPLIDANTVKQQAAGQKTGDITASLNSIPGVQNVSVKLSPFWVSKVPKSQGKIKVVLVKVATSKNGQ